jgi:hypothetical protein
MTNKEIILNQIALQEEIQAAGFNIVTCGNCGEVRLMRSADEELHCTCGVEMDAWDCPDLFYRGMENSDVYDETIQVWVNGDWDCSIDEWRSVIVFDKGTVHEMKESDYDNFINQLEEDGFDCYFCPQLFSHPEWNGEIEYVDSERGEN